MRTNARRCVQILEEDGVIIMGEIFEMPQRLREKIAAGEVITAPVSVVKELIENSMDAGADEIKAYFENGGKRLIRIMDNGKGMEREDLEICGKRFTTSKIHNERELEEIHTLGFRGEALASITTVSELTIQTRRAGTAKGYASEFHDDGRAIEIRESPITKGTIVEVRNLFGKFPVRLKFLKSDEIEASKITSLVTKYSLANPEMAFQLYKDGKEIFNSPKVDGQGKIFHAFGQEIAENVVKLDYESNGVAVSGYISKVGYSRKTRDYQVIFINGRLVKSSAITDAVEKGYADKIFLGRHPIAVLHITLDPEMIDVNIHPSKEEIKFKSEYAIVDTVINAVQKCIAQSSHAIEVEAGGKMARPAHKYEIDRGIQKALTDDMDELAEMITPKAKGQQDSQKLVQKTLGDKTKTTVPGDEFLHVNVMGQLNRTYILGYDDRSLILIDQHAAQERVFYERFTKQLKNKAIVVNRLLKPFVFSANREEEKFIEQNKGAFERYGFFVEQFSRGEYALTAIPALFGRAYDAGVIKDIIDELHENIDSGTTVSDELDHKIATKACRKAIKGGDILSIPEMKSLLTTLAECRNPYTCPHGRPTMLRMSWGDLEKKFKRSD